MRKPNFFEKRRQKKREEELKKLHSTPETYSIIHRIPNVGDTTVAYDFGQLLDFYEGIDQYVLQKIQSGIAIDEHSGNFLKTDIMTRILMLKTLLLEYRERHRNARISIIEEKNAYKMQLEKELEDLQKKYDELIKGV